MEERHQRDPGHIENQKVHIACGESLKLTIMHTMIKAFGAGELKFSKAKIIQHGYFHPYYIQ